MKILFLTGLPPQRSDEQIEYLHSRGHEVVEWRERLSDHPPPSLVEFDLILSWHFRHLLKPGQFDAPKYGAINVHPSYLPHGRGAMPNVWAIVEGAPAGATIHRIEAGIDTGPILAQIQEPVYPDDTGESLYWRLLEAERRLFQEAWPGLEQSIQEHGELPPGSPQDDAPSGHRTRDVEWLDDLSNFGSLAQQLIDVLRARTFTGHESAYLRQADGRKLFIRIGMSYEENETRSAKPNVR